MPENERAPVVLTLRFGTDEVGIVAPLPASLSREELIEALRDTGGDPMNVGTWLTDRLRAVTGRRYTVEEDIRGWEHDGPRIVYTPVRIRDANPAG